MGKITPFLWFDGNAEEAAKYYTSVFKNSKIKDTEATSFAIDCDSQEEVDYYWNTLTADGGEESMCGWLKDKYGLSWQVVPRQLIEMLQDKDPAKSKRTMDAMLQMN